MELRVLLVRWEMKGSVDLVVTLVLLDLQDQLEKLYDHFFSLSFFFSSAHLLPRVHILQGTPGNRGFPGSDGLPGPKVSPPHSQNTIM